MIKVAKKGINRFGARKYDNVRSLSKPNKFYQVVKVRVKGTRNYKYMCTCPDFVFRQKICKHIRIFKEKEKRK
jgi:hypothetical protein